MREEITQLRDEAAEKRDPMVNEDNFDPYYKWLGIPPEEQPPNHYRLLGVRLYETDFEVIESAADQRMTYVQQLATGPYSDLSQTLLNELAKARVCLLNSEKKADYDQELRKSLSQDQPPAEEQSPPAIRTLDAAEAPIVTAFHIKGATAGYRKVRRRRKNSLPVGWIAAAAVGVAAIVGGVWWMNNGDSNEAAPQVSAPDQDGDSSDMSNLVAAGNNKDASEQPATPDASPSAEMVAGKPLDLLKLIDPERDALKGEWRFEEGALMIPAGNRTRLQIPSEVPQEYVLRMVVERTQGESFLCVGLVAEGRQFVAALDMFSPPNVSRLNQMDGSDQPNETNYTKPLFTDGKPIALVITVRKTGVNITSDGREIMNWLGDYNRLSLKKEWSVPSQQTLFIGASRTSYRISKLELTPLKSSATATVDTRPPNIDKSTAQPPTEVVANRLPIPDADTVEQARKQIKTFYKDDYKKKNPVDKLALAKKLLQAGIEAKNKPVEQYVFLQESHELAAEAGDVSTGFSAIDELQKSFEVEDVLELKSAVLGKARRTARSPQALRLLLNSALNLIDQAVEADKYEIARRLDSLAVSLTRKTPLRKHVLERSKQFRAVHKAYQEVQPAIETLKKSPDNADANLEVGRFYCLAKGNWEKGLPLLAKGSDASLKSLAARDIAGTSDSLEQLALAEAWSKYSASQKGTSKVQPELRAISWYLDALPGLSGLAKANVEKLLDQLRKRGKLSISLLSDFDKTAKVIMGEWKVAGGSLTGAGASGHDLCTIELGNIPFKEYDFTTTFVIKRRKTDGFGDLFMRLPYLKQHLFLRTTKGTVGKTLIGFNISSLYVGPKSSATFPGRLTLGKPYHLLVRVREGSNVQILLDGKQIVATKVAAQERPNMSIGMTGVVAFKSLNFVAVH